MKRTPNGFTIASLILVLTAVLIVAGLNVLFVLNQQAATRDALRIADMARVEAAFALLSYETSSYKQAAEGCSKVGMAVSTCSLVKYLPTIASIKDPGKNAYVVTEVPADTSFKVTFTLEHGVGKMLKGRHVVSPNGIQ